MICPKCGRPVDAAAVICTGCDFILDTEFLGDGILDEEHTLRPGQGGVDPAAFNLADAVILGNIDEVSQSFETSDSGFHLLNDHAGARLYVSGRSQALMAPDAIPAMSLGGSDGVRLTPFERHVLAFIDGKRPVEVIRKAAGLDESEVKTALATLADKGVIKVVGRALVDFDPLVDTAPRQQGRRRMRGSVVGAVAVVGDEADQAIEEAFRTQVRQAPNLADLKLKNPSGPHGAVDDADVFGGGPMARLVSAPDGGSSMDASEDGDLPSDADSFSVAGTNEIDKRAVAAAARPAARGSNDGDGPTKAAQRPNAAPIAVNARSRSAPDALREVKEPEALEQRTALVQRAGSPSGGEDELSFGGSQGDVFADGGAGRGGLPGRPDPSLSGTSIPQTTGIADSRVMRRPKVASAAPRQPPRAAPMAADPATKHEPRPSSTSLSDLLSDGPGPQEARSAHASGFDGSGEEPTAQLPPPAPQALRPPPSLVVAQRPTPQPPPLARGAGRVAATSPPPQPSSIARDGDASNELDGDLAGAFASEDGSIPEASVPGDASEHDAGADDAPGDDALADDELYSDEAETLSARPSTYARALARPGGPSLAASFDDDSEDVSPPSISDDEDFGPASSEDEDDGFSGSDEPTGRPPQRGEPPGRVHSDLTGPPPRSLSDSEVEALASSGELISDDMIIRPAAKAMPLSAAVRAARDKSKPQDAAPRGHVDDEPSGDFEQPTPALAPPLAQPKRGPARGARAPLTAAPDASFADGSSDASDVEERTMKLDEMPKKRGKGEVEIGGRGDAVPIPSGLSRVVDVDGVAGPTGRSPKSGKSVEDMREKARALFDEARGDHAAGRIGAARMNAKLASIYDPSNAEYRRALSDWERAPAPKDVKGQESSRPRYVLIYEEAQEAEANGEIDRALELLREGIRLNSNVAAIHNRLGVLLALQKRDYKDAADAIQRAIELEPDNLHYKSNLGKIIAKARGKDRRGAELR